MIYHIIVQQEFVKDFLRIPKGAHVSFFKDFLSPMSI